MEKHCAKQDMLHVLSHTDTVLFAHCQVNAEQITNAEESQGWLL